MSAGSEQDIVDRLKNGCEKIFESAVHDLQELVRIPSLAGNEGEADAQRFMQKLLNAIGLQTDMWEIKLDDISALPGFSPPHGEWKDKLCVVGTHLCQTNKGKTLILNGHVDIVPTGPKELWTSGPYDPQIRDGRLYGRGSGDMKAGVIAMCYALKLLKSINIIPASTIHIQSVIDEECTGNGTLSCCAKGYRADCAVIPEPFHCVMTAQLGVMWFDIVVTGRPAHVLDTSMGSNAIEASFKVFTALKGLETQWNLEKPELYKHHKKPINFNLGKIDGGEWGSTVPSQCRMTVRIGYYPGVSLEDIRGQIEACIEKISADLHVTSVVEYHGFQAEGCNVDMESSMIQVVGDAHKAVTGHDVEKTPLTCTTDVRFFSLYYGIPATVYGPKYTKNIHSIDESVCLDSFKETIIVLALFIIKWCGVQDGSSC